jgi:hypothetical protein
MHRAAHTAIKPICAHEEFGQQTKEQKVFRQILARAAQVLRDRIAQRAALIRGHNCIK